MHTGEDGFVRAPQDPRRHKDHCWNSKFLPKDLPFRGLYSQVNAFL